MSVVVKSRTKYVLVEIKICCEVRTTKHKINEDEITIIENILIDKFLYS